MTNEKVPAPPRPARKRSTGLGTWAGIAGAAAIGAWLIPSGPPGIGLVIVGAAVAVAVGRARPRPLDLESGVFTAAALMLLAMAAVYDASWVIAVDVAAAACCSALAITGARRWVTVFTAPFGVLAEALRVPGVVVRSFPSGRPAPWLGPAGRAAALSLLLLVTFGTLFASADAAFARIAGDVLSPDVSWDLLAACTFVGAVIVAGAGGLILFARRPEIAPDPFTDGVRPLKTIEWAAPLLVLDALFLAFVLVQLTVLFGGHDHVLQTTGLTYAQYARAGFFQLVAIAALVLGVVALAVRLARPTRRERLLEGLLGVLCALTLVVLVSALRRMDLYEEAYGLTRIRISVYAVDLWLAAVFVAVIVAGVVRRATWLPRVVTGLAIGGLLLFNLSNPDARMAQSAVDRWERTGEIDGYYVSTLSADALPALTQLPPDAGGCLARDVAEAAGAPSPWSSFNLSRHRASRLSLPEDPTCD